MPKISIVIPVFNEEENIPELYHRLKKALDNDFQGFSQEIIFVDDGSEDQTFSLLAQLHQKDNCVKVIQFSRNFGHHIAISAGLDNSTGNFVVIMDGDLQDQPEEIIKLYNRLKEGFDVVYAERKNKKFGLFKKISSEVFNFLIKKLINEKIVINSTIFRIMTKQVVENIRLLKEQNRYLVGIIGWVGFKHTNQPVKHGKRFGGKSKYNLSKQFALSLNAVLTYSSYPLKIIIRIGFFLVIASFLLIVYIFIKKIVFDTPIIGWTSLITSIFIVGGIQIIILGIIGEYIGRNYIENKNRPLYIIRKQIK